MNAPEPTTVKFADPPVVEMILSAQFARLEGFSSAHSGWFWREHLSREWPSAKDAPVVIDQFEAFGSDMKWRRVDAVPVRMSQGEPERAQIMNESGTRMIQIQNSRFIFNWRKQGDKYPTYPQIFDEFRDYFGRFCDFCEAAKLGRPMPNQWEVTYINHILKGDLWQVVTDASNVYSWFSFPPLTQIAAEPEAFEATWRSLIHQNRGRLYVTLRSARTLPANEDVLLHQMLARGPVNEAVSLDAGLALGHSAIVQTFRDMTSSTAHARWGKDS